MARWASATRSMGSTRSYFFSSQLLSMGGGQLNIAYTARCTDVWFYGGEITARNGHDPEGSIGQQYAVLTDFWDGTIFRAFGASVISTAGPTEDLEFGQGVIAVRVNRGEFHIHGGIVRADASAAASGTDAIAVDMQGNGKLAHMHGTAFLVRAGSGGEPVRTRGDAAKVQAPFLWESGPRPPISTTEANVLSSLDGKDMFVETDCDATGDCDDAGSQTHLMIYNEAECGTSNPWFNVVTGSCRN
jgi:hypothetical protein